MIRKEGVVVIGMRSKRQWESVTPELAQVPFLKNWQRTHLSEGNMQPGIFQQAVNALRGSTGG
jgi:hypothetical protein